MKIQDVRRLRLAQLIKEKYEDKQSVFVAETGENQGEVSALLKNKSFGEKKARKIEEKCGMPAGWLDMAPAEGGEEEEDFAVPDDGSFEIIPQLDVEASCGHGKFQDYVQVKGGLVFKSETLRQWGITPNNGRIIYASGQSMEPTIQHGRVVLINTSETEPVDNKVFLICDSDGGIVLKRLVREYDSASGDMIWKMRSDNTNKRDFPDKPLPDGEHVTIVGRAVWNDSVL